MDRDTAGEPIGFVLIHGSELGAWVWDRLIPLLQRPTVAVDLPGRGSRPVAARSVSLEDAVQAVLDDAESCDADRVVVVAHSFSGVLVPPVVDRLGDRAAAVVLVGATVPEEGKSWADLLPAPQRHLLRLMYRVRPNGMLSPAGQNRKALCNDLDADTTAAFLERRVPEAPRFLLDKVSPALLPTGIPCHYLRLTDDRSITDTAREKMISRLRSVQTHDLASGHLPMLSRPEELAAVLEDIARGCEASAAP
ncbi:MAG: alpha/beta hydrolase [Actinomycetota bacterium]|nr:alpha/beta hydrolase [Actinomycetota bacterium]